MMFKVCLYTAHARQSAPSRPYPATRENGTDLVLVQPLDLHIKHRLRVHLEAERALDVLREPLLVALLHRRPALLEERVVHVLEQALSSPAPLSASRPCTGACERK